MAVVRAAPETSSAPTQQPGLMLFAAGLIGLGILSLVYGDFALVWQPVPSWVPGRTALAYGSGVLMLVCGSGLLFRVTAAWAVRILFPYLIAWALLKVPPLVTSPQVEASWLGFGEIAMVVAGGWTLFARLADLGEGHFLARLTGDGAVRMARMLFAVWVLPVGLSHFVYLDATAHMIPKWIPFPAGWGYLTGAGHIAAGLAVLFYVIPRWAAIAEAGMIGAFTLLIWAPAIAAAPRDRMAWTAFFISWIIGAAVAVVAQNIPSGNKAQASDS